MSSYREGRNFCKITILGKVLIKKKKDQILKTLHSIISFVVPLLWNLLAEDCCIKYKALHNLEKLMIGDFLANRNYIVTRQADCLTFLPLSLSLKSFHVTVSEPVLDHCLHNDLLFLLHQTAVSVYDLKTRSWRDKIVMIADSLVSIKVNDHVLVILDTSNTLHIFNLKGITFL